MKFTGGLGGPCFSLIAIIYYYYVFPLLLTATIPADWFPSVPPEIVECSSSTGLRWLPQLVGLTQGGQHRSRETLLSSREAEVRASHLPSPPHPHSCVSTHTLHAGGPPRSSLHNTASDSLLLGTIFLSKFCSTPFHPNSVNSTSGLLKPRPDFLNYHWTHLIPCPKTPY